MSALSALSALPALPVRLTMSVALATYNGGSYLREQLGSIRGQTLLPDELVVSDDGSTDDTLDVVRTFASTAPFPVRILDKTARLGFSDNFLHAAECCAHDVIAFCDQDDVWLPGKLQTGLRRLQADDSLLAMHRLSVTDQQLCPSGAIWTQGIDSDRAFDALALDPYINGWGNSMLVRRELVHLFPRARRPRQPERNHLPLSHDTWLYVLAAALGRVSHIMAPLLLYRQHGANAEGLKAAPKQRRLFSMLMLGDTLRRREQARFNDAMVGLFSELAARDRHPMAAAARAAADAFAKRRDLLLHLLQIYFGPSFVARLAAFHALQARLAPAAPRRSSLAKQVLIGVTGINRALDRSPAGNAPATATATASASTSASASPTTPAPAATRESVRG